jgi:5-methyltetrahydrofolate--homocysteine methyltransferase
MSDELAKLLSDLQETEALDFVKRALAEGSDPMGLLEKAREGITIVGERFASGDYFIPDLIYSGEILKEVVKLLEPHFGGEKGEKTRRLGPVIIGTVAGDIHDIGKDLVVFMLDISGYEVMDLGIDVPAQKFVDAIKETGSRVVGLSGFLTLAFDSMKETIDAIKAAGLRENIKVMVGGGQIDDQVMRYTGADAYGRDAMQAVKLTQGWIGG